MATIDCVEANCPGAHNVNKCVQTPNCPLEAAIPKFSKEITTCHDLCRRSYQHTEEFITIKKTRFGVFFLENVVYVVVRGTANFSNVLKDLYVLPKRSPKGFLCHAGFLQGFKDIQEYILHRITDLTWTQSKPRIIFTGHSYGGAIATLLCEHFGGELITFGSPKVYFRFSKAPVLNHTRIIQEDDPVPKVPAIFYTHRISPFVIEDSDFSMLDIKDHSIENYLEL